MLAEQRHAYVLERLTAEGAVRVTDVVAGLGVSDGTVRRDLELLEQQGLLTRVRGGAVPVASSSTGAMSAGSAAVAGGPRSGANSRGGAVLGMLVPSTTYYYPEVIRGAQEAAAGSGARIVLAVSDYGAGRDMDQLRDLIRSGCDGLLVATGVGPLVPAPVLGLLAECGLPYVLVERRSAASFDHAEYVLSDHRQGAYRAVEHLARLGHRGVALFAYFTVTTKPVAEGHAAAVRLLGLDGSAPVMTPEDGADRLAAVDAFADACRASGTTAALVHSDQEAILLVQRLRTQGARIPEDFAVIAYDDEVAAFAQVPLTAVAPAKFEVGRTAAAVLLGRIGADGDPPVRQTVLQPKLMVRASCGAPPGGAASGALSVASAAEAAAAAIIPAVAQ